MSPQTQSWYCIFDASRMRWHSLFLDFKCQSKVWALQRVRGYMYIDKPTTRRTHAEHVKRPCSRRERESTLDRRMPGVRTHRGLRHRGEPSARPSPGAQHRTSETDRSAPEAWRIWAQRETLFLFLESAQRGGKTQSGPGCARYPGAHAWGGSQRLSSVAKCGSRGWHPVLHQRGAWVEKGWAWLCCISCGTRVMWEPPNGPVYCKGARGLNRVGPQGTLDREHGQNQQFDLHGPTPEDQMENSSVNTWTCCSPTPSLPLRNGRIPIQLRFSFHNLEK